MQTQYLILTLRTPQFDPAMIAPHYAFLDALQESGQLVCFGGFADKSGGAYVIRAHNLAEAQSIAQQDPLHTSQSSLVQVYEWQVKEVKV
ncbi:MAG: YciI family protein [Formosimonas sp.]